MNAAATKGLGKGLSALMGESYSQTVGEGATTSSGALVGSSLPQTLPIKAILPGKFQPRTRFDEEYLNELADSIEKNGVMQPIIVRPLANKANHYEIVAGERRWRASQLAKLEHIPVIIREMDDQLALELALVENIQRQDLNPLEEALGYQRLISEFSYTQDSLARTIGKSRSHIANLLRLLGLPQTVQDLLASGELTMGHARAIATSPDAEKLAKRIVSEGLNVRQTEQIMRGEAEPATPARTGMKSTPSTPRSSHKNDKDQDIVALEETLSASLGLTVSINTFGAQKGEVVISYGSLTQLDEILRRLSDGF